MSTMAWDTARPLLFPLLRNLLSHSYLLHILYSINPLILLFIITTIYLHYVFCRRFDLPIKTFASFFFP